MASFSGSKFSSDVKFGQARFRAGAMFNRVTFCGQADFYASDLTIILEQILTKQYLKKLSPSSRVEAFIRPVNFMQ